MPRIAEQPTHQNRRALADADGRQQYQRRCGCGNQPARHVGAQDARHAPNSLRDNRHRDQLQSVQQAQANDAVGQAARTIGEQPQQNRRGQGESDPGHEAAPITGTQQPNGKSQFARSRSGQELTQPDQIRIRALAQPAPLLHEFRAEITEMRDRPAEAGHSQAAENPQHLQRRPRAMRCGQIRIHHADRVKRELRDRIAQRLTGKESIEILGHAHPHGDASLGCGAAQMRQEYDVLAFHQ